MMFTKRQWKAVGWIFLLVGIWALLLSCNVDHGLAPLPGQLNLKVYFRNEPPPNTQGIYLMVSPEFPPHAINEVHHSPNSLPIDQDTVYHHIYLPYGHYDALALWWYSKETESNLADVLSIPIDYTEGLRPLGFDITPENPVVDIEVDANWNKVNRDAQIEGTIYFDGPFPDDTQIVAVAAFKMEPLEPIDYLVQLKSIDFSIDRDENPYHYKLPVRSGSINYIGVYWLKERAGIGDFKPVGEYKDPENPESPGTLRLRADDVVTGLDIYVDWSNVEQL
ncbi:hypothetical protein EH223_19800 [candidate division KSB1 bacterium]|nr:hypothetical protein [candidate division KSB1 bacterium]RQW00188.1 MAG: hypothetical protein EH223_19800 [candidate division KSB1 bacterium]